MTEEKLYPTLATAPPYSSTTPGHYERYQRIAIIQAELNQLLEKRHIIYKKYSKASSFFNAATTTLASLATIETTAGIITSATVIGLPIGIILSGLGAGSGGLALLFIPLRKYCEKKKSKHLKKHAIINTGVNMIYLKVSKALNDDSISDEEFNNIIYEYEAIRKLLFDINIEELKKEIKKELTSKLI